MNSKQSLSYPFFRPVIVLFFLFLFVTCITGKSIAKEQHHAPSIEVTLPALAGILHWVKPELHVRCMLADGAEPHHFQPGTRQIERMMQAALVLRSSADDHLWFNNHHLDQARILDLWPLTAKGENHAWLDPYAVAAILPRLQKQLATLNVDIPTTNEHRLKKEWQQLLNAWQELLPILRQRGVIMQHASWKPWFEHLGVPVYSVLERPSSGHHHGGFHAKTLEHALAAVQTHPQALLIADPRHDDQGLQWLKEQHPSSQLVWLTSIGTCQQSWLELMHDNIKQLTRMSSNTHAE